ncbi:cell division protein FtsA [Bacteroides sp. 51]|uniref:cell division protein FtsA n=1 Tax=Bacteroides sp. 51 TaxID=2302938 RepID=UPI0013D2A503|nr:cell division protein FtsA [Bacteroides sp. 51]
MSTTDFIAAIELGSSKIVGIVGKKNGDGSIQILARAREESSSFIRKGVIFNLDKTAQSLTSIINKLESSLNSSIGKVYVGISGQSLHTVKNSVTRDLKDETVISQELIDAICDENLGTRLDDMDILDVAPQEYKVGNTLLPEAVGVPAHHIEGNFMNIVARTALRKNLERCFDLAKIEIAEIFISPIVTAQAILTESEMRSGCALVDFGAATTTISVYKGNILRFLSVLPLGGNSITLDIASLHMEEREAEKLKLKYGNAIFDQESEAQGPETVQSEDSHTKVEFYILNDIIEARAEEIVANVCNQIELSGYADKLLSGIVTTGGGANLKNIDELLRKKSKIDKVRVALAPHFNVSSSAYADLKDGTQNTLFGLIASGTENCYLPKVEEPADPSKGLFADDADLIAQEAAAREEKERRDKEEKEQKEAERIRKKEEKKNRPNWFKSTFDKLSNEIFSDEDMK